MECGIALESLQGNPASRCAEGGILRSFSSSGRKPCVCSTCDGDLRELLLCLLEVRNTVDLGGASRNPLVLVQWKSASSRVEAGTSGFLSCCDVGLGLCMPFITRSQVSTCVESRNSAFLSSCQSGFRLLTELNLEPGALFKLATGASELPWCCELIPG